jgi:hypothetical protein
MWEKTVGRGGFGGGTVTDGLAILVAWLMFGLLVAALVGVILHGGKKE